MKRYGILVLLVVAAMVSSCTTDLGLGEADCSPPNGDVSASNIMTIQAVPTAKYTPCLNELRLGWDTVNWFAENGRAGIEIAKNFEPFLTATVTESCDVSGAVAVDSGFPDIQRFEDVESQQAEIQIIIVPSADVPLAAGRRLVDRLTGVQIDDRPVTFTIDDATGESVTPRVDRAISRGAFVWIIDELDVEENTVQLRSGSPTASGRGLQPDDAMDLIDDAAPGVSYRGNWYFTFDGGCITYDFDATGILAESVAADAEDALGFYPALQVRQGARASGIHIGDADG